MGSASQLSLGPPASLAQWLGALPEWCGQGPEASHRGWKAAQLGAADRRGAAADRGGTAAVRRETVATDRRGAAANRGGTTPGRRETVAADRCGAAADRGGTTAVRRETVAADRGGPATYRSGATTVWRQTVDRRGRGRRGGYRQPKKNPTHRGTLALQPPQDLRMGRIPYEQVATLRAAPHHFELLTGYEDADQVVHIAGPGAIVSRHTHLDSQVDWGGFLNRPWQRHIAAREDQQTYCEPEDGPGCDHLVSDSELARIRGPEDRLAIPGLSEPGHG